MTHPHAYARQATAGPGPADVRASGPPDLPLLTAKLAVPAVPPAHIRRQRLLDRMTHAVQSRLTAVIGPAGYGKTVLASSWMRTGAASGAVAWLTLDNDDNAPLVFWSYVVEALRGGRGAGADTPRPTMQGNQVDRTFLAQLAAELAGLAEPAVLVLDQAEMIVNRAIGADLDLLLRYSAPGLHLVVVGRNAPLLPLHRYRLAGDLSEIGPEDLALLPEESADVLQRHGLSLKNEDVDALFASTEGWVTGVRLHALARRAGGVVPVGPASPANHRAVADFLRTEVLDQQPARTRDLLLRTSIVDEVHSDLADRLTGRYDGRGILDELVRRNAFVQPLEDLWYRYQPLFREVLHDELATHHPELMRRLHSQAAHWYADHDRPADAVHHAAQVGDWAYAAHLAVTRLGVTRLLTAPDAEALRTLLADLPDDQAGAAAALVRATLALGRFDTAAARAAVNQAHDAARREPDDAWLSLRLGIATVRVLLARYHGDVEAMERATSEMDSLWTLLPPDELALQADTRALVMACLGAVQMWAGRVGAARASLGRAATATEPGTGYAAHDALAHLALLELNDGKLYPAERFARESIAVADRAGLRPGSRVGAASAALAAVALMWNDMPAVREHLSRAIAAAGSRHDPTTATTISLVRAYIASGRRDGRRTLVAVDAIRANAHRWQVYPAVQDVINLVEVGAQLMLGDFRTARRILETVPDSAHKILVLGHLYAAENEPDKARAVLSELTPRNSRAVVLQYSALTLARLAYADGDTAGAVRALRDALEYGRAEHRRRPIVEAGPWVGQLLRQHLHLATEHAWLARRPNGPEVDPAEAVVVVEPLTDREIEVLRRLAQAMTTEEIANSLYLSINTVKTHLKSIYRKLGVSGRSAAARRARELNLLGDSEPDAR